MKRGKKDKRLDEFEIKSNKKKVKKEMAKGLLPVGVAETCIHTVSRGFRAGVFCRINEEERRKLDRFFISEFGSLLVVVRILYIYMNNALVSHVNKC